MTLSMADSTVPAQLPPGMDAYAGYDDGNWPDYEAIAAAHPGAHLVELTVFLRNQGTGADDEPGDLTDDEMVTYLAERMAAGKWRPIAYRSIDGMEILVGKMFARGIAQAQVRILSAHYGAGRHICGPTTCGHAIACDGTQWIDHGGWDESVLADDFFGDEMSAAAEAQINDLHVQICTAWPSWVAEFAKNTATPVDYLRTIDRNVYQLSLAVTALANTVAALVAPSAPKPGP